MINRGRGIAAVLAVALVLVSSGASPAAQTSGQKEDFTAIAMVNDENSSGAGHVLMQVTRWSTEAERTRLVNTLMKQGDEALLEALRDMRPVGTIRTPDSLGYDLRFAYQEPTEDGGRRIVLATDRPIGFWEMRAQSRTLNYPFTVIQMEFARDGKGKGTLSAATKVIGAGNTIVLENFTTSPVMLTEIEAKTR
jgi:hypothetical protein